MQRQASEGDESTFPWQAVHCSSSKLKAPHWGVTSASRRILRHSTHFKACDSDFDFQLCEPFVVYGLSK